MSAAARGADVILWTCDDSDAGRWLVAGNRIRPGYVISSTRALRCVFIMNTDMDALQF